MNATLNMDYQERLVIAAHNEVGEEIALENETGGRERTTTVLQMPPDTALPPVNLPGGEELFILEGDLSDDQGSYGAGTYLKTPAGQTPRRHTKSGCRLFVKRNHLAPEDLAVVRIDTGRAEWFQGFGMLNVLPLHEYEGRSSALVYWPPGATFQPHKHWGGEEIFVIDGTFQDEHGDYPRGTWLRSPHLSTHNPFSREGCLILVKVGHLA